MRLLIVFDGTFEAEQNLRKVLLSTQVEDKPEFLICIPELLREDEPLDDYLGEMEETTKKVQEWAEKIVTEANAEKLVTVKVVRGMELDAANLIARKAYEWQADEIYLSISKECASYLHSQDMTASRQGFFSKLSQSIGFKPKKKAVIAAPAIELSYINKPVFAADLIPIAPCRVNIGYGEQDIFSIRTF